jgi:hypothetical protein
VDQVLDVVEEQGGAGAPVPAELLFVNQFVRADGLGAKARIALVGAGYIVSGRKLLILEAARSVEELGRPVNG